MKGTKPCAHCGSLFTPNTSHQLYCRNVCWAMAGNKRNKHLRDKVFAKRVKLGR